MKVLIIYATRGGVSKRCAEMLGERLCDSMQVDTFSITDGAPAPDGYDVCVIGGSVRMTRINRHLRSYLKTHAETLNRINTALFMCCGITEDFDDYVKLNFPKSVVPSLGIHYFGGELKPEKLKGIDKLIVRSMRSTIKYEDFEAPDPNRSPLPEILPESIYRLADNIRALL
jgi:menaquinone-dependent protoporphyrinogen oxidase